MAVNDETIRYFPGAVNGTAAYDLSRYEQFDYGTSAPEAEEPYEEEAREPISRGGAHAAAQTNLKIRPFSVIGVLLTAAIAVLALLANLRLTAITAETVELEQQLEALEEERTQLQIRYENTFDLTEIEEYATKTLGMVRLQDDQIVVLDGTAEDRAEILREDRGEAFFAVLRDAGSLWDGIKAYFIR